MNVEEIERAISDLEINLERLGALYNQYFMGIERTEPLIPRKNVDREIAMLRREQIHNTALRFRLQTQILKYNTQSNHWKKVCREIEEGTYKRHVMLAKRRMEARAVERKSKNPRRPSRPSDSVLPEAVPSGEIDLDLGNGFALDEPFQLGEQAPPQPENVLSSLDDPFGEESKKKLLSAAIPSPRPAEPPKLDAARARAIFRSYVAARSKCNEPTENLTLDKMTKSLEKQYAEKGGNVDFKVVIRKGKAAIKTIKK